MLSENQKKTFLSFTILVIILSIQSFPQSIFDLNFGSNGITIPVNKTLENAFESLSLQSDNKIILTGWSNSDASSPTDISILRLFENGELDTGFNSSGIFQVGNRTWEDAFSSAIQSDGKILIAGRYFDYRNWNFIIIRFNENGQLDSSFNNKGYFIKDFFGKDDRCFSIDIQPDGKIVACGFAQNFNWDFAIIRLNPDGTIDSSFGNNGSKVLNIASYNDVAFSVKAQKDGKIILAGWAYISNSWDFAIVRLNSDGSLDNSFALSGIVTTDYYNLYNTAHSIAIQSDGKYIAAGYTLKSEYSDTDIMLVRYNSNGSIDRTFGKDGIVLLDNKFADDFAWVVKTDNFDKILVAGYSSKMGSKKLLASRLNSNGSTDISFGENGIFLYEISGYDEEIRDLLVQPDGKIILAGYFTNQLTKKGFVLKLNNPYRKIDKNPDILLNNFPNPFSKQTKISYIVKTDFASSNKIYLHVKLKVYDLLGREIETLVDDFKEPGYYEVIFPQNSIIENLSNGIYFYRIEINGISKTNKMILVR